MKRMDLIFTSRAQSIVLDIRLYDQEEHSVSYTITDKLNEMSNRLKLSTIRSFNYNNNEELG